MIVLFYKHQASKFNNYVSNQNHICLKLSTDLGENFLHNISELYIFHIQQQKNFITPTSILLYGPCAFFLCFLFIRKNLQHTKIWKQKPKSDELRNMEKFNWINFKHFMNNNLIYEFIQIFPTYTCKTTGEKN